ncbi:MAG: phosphomethylpyrimidine synthase ThiC [Firmicutes bacterium]|nr:phosphomethylpyrimidine synthase ThiC [Bacillota bacterium]
MENAREGLIEEAVVRAGLNEGVAAEDLARGLAEGVVVVPANPNHRNLVSAAIGRGLRTKVNANLGTSSGVSSLADEKAKLQAALEAGADAVMDLSIGEGVEEILRELLAMCPVPFGTVPIYQAALKAREERGSIVEMTVEDIFDSIERQARAGVDFITVHTGLRWETIGMLQSQGRVADVVSRGGSFTLAWMLHHQKENPLYENFDRLLHLARRYELILSLGDALRPGAIADATDQPQVHELLTLGTLVKRCREAGVQCMVEGPGHVPLDQVEANVILQKRLCGGAPFYVLGPLVTDVAPGYDHITSAIGGAIAAMAGADFLCYVTPAEHLGLPGPDDVRDGVIAARIAGHAADIVKGVPGAREWDRRMSTARKALDWEAQERLALDPSKVRAYRGRRLEEGECTMCGPFCAMKVISQALGGEKLTC